MRTREGLQKLNAEQADIFHTDRPVSAADKQEYGLQSVLFAIDGIAAAVHSNNPVQDLSPGQLQDIFAADISCWAEVGGEQGEVNIYTREEGSGSTSTFRKQALNGGYIADSAREVDSCGRMKQAVSRDSQAIGYVRIPRLDKSIAPVALNGVRPEAENILDCSYPVKEHFYMYTREQTRPLTRSFIEYILGTEGAQLIRERGFIPAEQ